MLISLNSIKTYVPNIKISTKELIELIGSRLVEVEGHTDLAPKYAGIKIVKVVTCEAIPETHLHLCSIDAGEASPIQVVCGAPNVHAGMLTAWIMPGSIVPSTYGGEDFRLSVRKLRGYDSHGMLAAADELALGSAHDGIIEIDPYMQLLDGDSPRPVRPGDDFAVAFDLNDIILDIENKSLTHRPDCFGLIGFAREVAGILGQKFEYDLPSAADKRLSALDPALAPQISIADPVLCPRYSCAVLDCGKLLEKNKYFTRTDAFLAKSGMRSVSPIVDLTNVLMLETGQPLHAFDYDKFLAVGCAKTPRIIVRLAKPGEKLQLLDGKTIECVASDILITSNDVPVALAGAMGGASTEIDQSSTRIILESATFSLYNLRKTQMAHGIFSEAITRFTKGQPPSSTLPVLNEAIRRLDTAPIAIADEYPHPAKPSVVKITTEEINRLLGTSYDTGVIKTTLENVGFEFLQPTTIQAPLWRTDIHIKEDIIEEVGRLLGFDNITPRLPLRTFAATAPNPTWQLKSHLRNIISDRLGAHELLTYSFVSGDLLTKVGEEPADSYQIVNSLSPELQYFRQTLTPSLLDKIYQNLKSGHSDFTLYEINQISSRREGLNPEKVPILHTHLAVITFGDFYRIKQIATAISSHLRIPHSIQPFASGPAYFESIHSAKDDFGFLGEIRKSVLKKFKLDQYQISALEWDIAPILDLPQSQSTMTTLAFSKFPAVSRDITCSVPSSITYEQLSTSITTALRAEALFFELTPVSIYSPSDTLDNRNISFHLRFSSPVKTLANTEISDIIEKVIAQVSANGIKVI